jgi:hypothetical protein
MAALTARRQNPRLKAFADRLAAAGKSKLTVIIAVLHKLLIIAFCMLKNNTGLQPNSLFTLSCSKLRWNLPALMPAASLCFAQIHGLFCS